MVNKVILVGRLGKDPEVRRFDNNGAVCNFSLATDSSYKNKAGEWVNETEWHNIAIWRSYLVDSSEKFLKKGSLVYIEGKLATRSWDDQAGVKKYTTEIVVDILRRLEKSTDANGENYSQQATNSTPQSVATPSPTTEDVADDLPF
ncbi:MAG: single-strand DNA-binding protein [Planctomycetota bacterium]|jgi:single-strand DNA-binding protein